MKPHDAFSNWFSGLDLKYRLFFSSLYFACLGDDVGSFLNASAAEERFLNLLEQRDFPIRKAMLLIQIRGFMDFIVNAISTAQFSSVVGPVMLAMGAEQFTADLFPSSNVLQSWRRFREQNLTDDHILGRF